MGTGIRVGETSGAPGLWFDFWFPVQFSRTRGSDRRVRDVTLTLRTVRVTTVSTTSLQVCPRSPKGIGEEEGGSTTDVLTDDGVPRGRPPTGCPPDLSRPSHGRSVSARGTSVTRTHVGTQPTQKDK